VPAVVDRLAPIFLIMGLGMALRRPGFLSGEVQKGLNRLIYWVGLPAYLFVKVSTAEELTGGGAMRVFGVLAAVTAGCVAAGYAAAWACRVPRSAWGAFTQGAMRGNLAFVGWPVITYAMATGGAAGQLASGGGGTFTAERAVTTLMVLAVAPLVPLYNVLAVVMLAADAGATTPGRGRLRAGWGVVKAVAGNPLVIACALALPVSLAGWRLPEFLLRTGDAVGQMTLPLALLAVGAALGGFTPRGRVLAAAAAAGIKVAAAPLLAWAICLAIGLDAGLTRMALIYAACPTAVASYVLADQMHSDATLARDIVVLSTALSFPALALVLTLT